MLHIIVIILLTLEAQCTSGYATRTHFNFLINQPQLCAARESSSQSLFIVAYVHSSPEHFERRNVIRHSWANLALFEELGMQTFFVVGIPRDETVLQRIHMESRVHRDIVMADFVDTYKNLTLKNLAGLRFVRRYCKHVPYVIKADDDAFIDVFRLVHILRQFELSDESTSAKRAINRKFARTSVEIYRIFCRLYTTNAGSVVHQQYFR